MTLAAAAAAAAIAALVLVPCDYEIEAPAILVPLVERNVFATVDGRVTAVHVDDGEQVAAGQILAELADPQLNLDLERVRGEIATIRKRNEAIAVARTDRTPSDDDADRLPLAAQAQQLELQLASLEKQLAVLGERKSALRLTSPIAGQVITLDVQHLLTSRPVERGQVLFTVADTMAGWELAAEVAQRDLGAVVTAGQANATPLAARFRLPGQSERVFEGHVRAISARALLDPEELAGEAPAVEVRVTVDEAKLTAARPGMNAEVRIDCGRRSLGYVWLHDAWETVYAWLVF
jgi:multidrug efflux pump subunit AcrA (membrane-fusion protein)